MKECPSCNASVPDSADVCPACSLTFGDDDGDARKTMMGMSFAAERDGVDDATSTADGAPTAGSEQSEAERDTPEERASEDGETDESAEELLFNLDFRNSREPPQTSPSAETSDDGDQPLRVSDDASPSGTLQGTGSEASDDEDASANPATRTHDGLPEFQPGRDFGGRQPRDDASRGDVSGGGQPDDDTEEPSRRVEARDLDSVRDAFRKRSEEEAGESASASEQGAGPGDEEGGPRPEDFSETPGSGIFKVPGKKKKKAQPGHASEQSGSGIIKRPDRSSKNVDEPTANEETPDGLQEESDVVGGNTYLEEMEASDDVPDVRQTAQVAEPDRAVGGWNRADETARIRPDPEEKGSEPQPSQPSLTGETDVISEDGQHGASSWVALVAGLLWVIAADQIWVAGSFEEAAIQVKFTTAMLGAFWSLFGPFLVGGGMRAYGHVILGALAGSVFAATLAVTGLALGDIAGLLGAVVLIVAGVLDH